jgi:hypothetical protein
MDLEARVAALIASPKARWALAWLAAAPVEEPRPADFQDAASARLRNTRLHLLRARPAGLVAEVHTRVEDWRYQCHAHTAVAGLGPAEGYRRIATALAKAPGSAWWWQPVPLDAQTWICADPGIRRGRGLPFRTSYGHHWDATAPVAAMTTSTRLPGLPATALLSDQNEHPPLRTDPALLSAWSAPIKQDVRVAEIHSPDDWISLVDRYPSHRTDLCQAPRLQAEWPAGALIWSVDWQRLSRDYDGVHLSVAGWLTATSQILSIPGRGLTICEGWPTEATMWFRPVFTAELQRLQVDGLEYGYGRPVAGSRHDLTKAPAPLPWWKRWLAH